MSRACSTSAERGFAFDYFGGAIWIGGVSGSVLFWYGLYRLVRLAIGLFGATTVLNAAYALVATAVIVRLADWTIGEMKRLFFTDNNDLMY